MASLQKLDTILYAVQQACIQMSLPPPTGVFDSADENALLMGSVANLAGIMVGEAFEWQQLRKEFLITGDGVRDAWDLPPDFSRFVDGTGWSYAIRQPIVVINPQQWASVRGWSPASTLTPVCRILQDQLRFLGPPANGGDIRFEYIDANWVLDADDNTVTKQKLTKNGDMPRFDWLLMLIAVKVKWLEQKGMSTIAAQADFNERLLQLTQRDEMGQALTLSGATPGGARFIDLLNAPDSGYGM